MQRIDSSVNGATRGMPAKQRAVERSIKITKLRAEHSVQRFLEAAQEITREKGAVQLTVHEVVERSHQSLRTFYRHFHGKHELLLALFENSLLDSANQIQVKASCYSDPLDRLKLTIQLLFKLFCPASSTRPPLFADLALELLISHPTEVKPALAPLVNLLTDVIVQAQKAGKLRPEVTPSRIASYTIKSILFSAQTNGTSSGEHADLFTGDEIWDFCALGFVNR